MLKFFMIHHDPWWSIIPNIKKNSNKNLEVLNRNKKKTADHPSILAAWRLLKGSTGLTTNSPMLLANSVQTWIEAQKKICKEFFFMCKNSGKIGGVSHVALDWLDAFTTLQLSFCPWHRHLPPGYINWKKLANSLDSPAISVWWVWFVMRKMLQEVGVQIYIYIYIYIHCVYIC